jgi:two-component system KDP operon response regulator KdpE
LLARIRAAFRRKARSLDAQPTYLQLGDIAVDFKTREITGHQEKERLTPKEYDLLAYLASRPNQVVTHRELLREVWGPDSGDEKEYLRVFINRLRKKIERLPDSPEYLLTEPWVGYCLRLPK